MQIAIDGREGYCASLEYAMDKVFHHAAKWTVIEGVGALFVVLGVGGISTGSDGLVRSTAHSTPAFACLERVVSEASCHFPYPEMP